MIREKREFQRVGELWMAQLEKEEAKELGREVWAETILTRAFRNILDAREWTAALGSKRCQVLAERLARAAVAALKERHLLASERDEEDETKQSDAAGDGGSAAADAGAR
mgnify:CR=1 FL=1